MGIARRVTFQNVVHEAASATRGFRAGKPSLGGADVRARNPRRRSERTEVPRLESYLAFAKESQFVRRKEQRKEETADSRSLPVSVPQSPHYEHAERMYELDKVRDHVKR